jgi:Tfp pilus assembly protein PilW
MKVFSTSQPPARGARARGGAGMTITELLVSLCIFSLVVLALIYAQMFGMRYDQLVNSKLGASDNTRGSFDKLLDDIRGAKILAIGNGSLGSFTACGNGVAQQGNMLQINLTTDTNNYVQYCFSSSLGQLLRQHNNQTATMLATNLLNTNVTATPFFVGQTYNGSNATDINYSSLIVANFKFYEYRYPLTKVGSNCYYINYDVQLKATSHCW